MLFKLVINQLYLCYPRLKTSIQNTLYNDYEIFLGDIEKTLYIHVEFYVNL